MLGLNSALCGVCVCVCVWGGGVHEGKSGGWALTWRFSCKAELLRYHCLRRRMAVCVRVGEQIES